ncbi:MAG: DUF1566 domain-containing protein [Chlorobiaceae bacterium]|nr:DUF1566 domain-containing protein [Chlorobiaceae bacterium]
MMNRILCVTCFALFLAFTNTGAAQKNSASITPAIGNSYEGGKIVYLLKPGEKGYDPEKTHGIIADTADLPGVFDWPDALAACERLKKNGYSDWYLPDRNELEKLYANRFSAGGFVRNGKQERFYWSSSEKDADYSRGRSFKTGKELAVDKMSKTGYARAVRTF